MTKCHQQKGTASPLLLTLRPQMNFIFISWEFIRKAESQASPLSCWIRFCTLARSPGDFHTWSGSRGPAIDTLHLPERANQPALFRRTISPNILLVINIFPQPQTRPVVMWNMELNGSKGTEYLTLSFPISMFNSHFIDILLSSFWKVWSIIFKKPSLSHG